MDNIISIMANKRLVLTMPARRSFSIRARHKGLGGSVGFVLPVRALAWLHKRGVMPDSRQGGKDMKLFIHLTEKVEAFVLIDTNTNHYNGKYRSWKDKTVDGNTKTFTESG